MHRLNLINIFIMIWAARTDVTDGSDNCRYLYPVDIRLCDIEGFWYWVFSTNHNYYKQDCSGFFGQMFSYTHGSYTTTGRKGQNPTLQAQIINREIVLYPTDPYCNEQFSYKVALVEKNYICFYSCGLMDLYDYAQCFSRNQRQSDSDRKRIYNGLRFFGLILAQTDLKLVNRAGCPEKFKPPSKRINEVLRANA